MMNNEVLNAYIKHSLTMGGVVFAIWVSAYLSWIIVFGERIK